MKKTNTPLVPVFYPFFPHYRSGVMDRLALSGKYRYEFIGDDHDFFGGSIAAFQPQPFKKVNTFVFFKKIYFQFGILKFLFRQDCNVFIIHPVPHCPVSLVLAFLGKVFGKKVVFWTQGWIRREKGLKGLVYFLVNQMADGLMLYGHTAERIAASLGIPNNKIQVIYNSLDVQKQNLAMRSVRPIAIKKKREELFGNAKIPVVVCPSRLIRVRRLELLVDAISKIEINKRPALLLIGDGPERPSLEGLAKERGVALHITGECYDEKIIAPLIMCASVCVAPGKVGLTAMHAMGYGIPVITHDCIDEQMPEYEAVLPGETGDFFRKDDVFDLARKIENWLDRKDKLQIKKNCLKMITNKYSPKAQVQLIEKALDIWLA